MSFQISADSFGIRILGLRCSWWHSRQSNDAVASERRIFSENQDYKVFFRVAVNPFIPIFRSLDACGGRKLRKTDRQTDTHTHIHRTTTVTLAKQAPRVNNEKQLQAIGSKAKNRGTNQVPSNICAA